MSLFLSKKILVLAAVAVLLVPASLVRAQTINSNDPLLLPTTIATPTPSGGNQQVNDNQPGSGPIPTIINPVGAKGISDLVSKVIRILFGLIALVAVVVIIIAGFRLVAYGSNPGERTKAKNSILWAAIGLLVALMAFSVVGIIQKLIAT